MTSKYLDLLLNEEYINELALKVGLCKRIRKIKPLELVKMLVFSQSNIAKDNLLNISLNLYGLPPTKRGNPPLRNKYSKNS